jgi:hypothetical protein
MYGGLKKRPLGITLIAIVWFLSGLVNIFLSFQTISQDVQALSYLSNSNLHAWFSFGVPAEMLLGVVGLLLGVMQIITVLGLWAGKTYSYKLALAIPIVLIIENVSAAGLYASASAQLELGTYVSSSLMLLVWSVIWLVVYWAYFSKPYVKDFLGVGMQYPPPPPLSTLTTFTAVQPPLATARIVEQEPKFFGWYCGSQKKNDAIYCEKCGKSLRKRETLL